MTHNEEQCHNELADKLREVILKFHLENKFDLPTQYMIVASAIDCCSTDTIIRFSNDKESCIKLENLAHQSVLHAIDKIFESRILDKKEENTNH